jgi:hypothetical protein
VASVWDAIADAELKHAPLCNISLDFTAAFDRNSHTYLFRTPKNYDYSIKIIPPMQAIYDRAFSWVQINGYVAGPFPIQCPV